ncbi:ImmA/IrrE family metallo-endopeptidase [Aliiruegeria lutimaris]|uniref:IrrE N-terminal-like domain-containing protein n=1 Tax=Aliiruegeria lutimaris TaxID=571298 RepID=A0A1G9DN79_9RHOB|nr:ImmA/IrrE family metallo-endopeptidase [Aliiruegeria lutimaris]SDK65366.1 protein of unknown function [Aliiruegeria lutimaris]
MHLDRIDLADIHEPSRLAAAVHGMLGPVDGPVPVDDVACALDIHEVRLGGFDGFEGMLLTDRVRSTGAILANTRKDRRRTRFTVAHELGHFLMERHVLSDGTGFKCQAKDLWETRDEEVHLRQETEANRFAIELLAPPALFDPHLSTEPDLRDALHLRGHLDISLEASVRRMIERRPECLAAVWSHEGRVRYVVRGTGFPYVPLQKGDHLPRATKAFRVIETARPEVTDSTETPFRDWTRQPALELLEQTRLASNGHAVTLLWARQ